MLTQAQTGPTITCVPGFSITCETDIIVDTTTPFVSTDCGLGINSVTSSGPVIAGPRGCTGATYTITYTVVDECGLSASCDQTFTIANQVGPSIISCPANQTVSCSFNVFPQPHLVAVESPCGLTPEIEVVGPQVFGPEECSNTQYIYTYIARDQCGRSAQCQQIFTLANEGPEFVCPPDICVLDCPADGDMIAAQFASFATQATIVNPCGNVSNVSNNFDPSRFINANCGSGPIAYENAVQYQIVTFSASDACFGFDNCTALVVVVDNTPPVITGSPQLGIRECNDLTQSQYEAWIQQNLNNMSAEDACSNVTWSVTPDVPVEICGANGYAITEVFFTATDDCGNSTTLEAHFKLKNNFPPEFVNPIPNIEVACGDPADFIEPAIRNACGETVVTSVDSELPGGCAGTPTLVRTYTVTDGCGNSSTVTQTITVTDNEGPIFTDIPPTINFDCGETPVFTEPVAVDACGGLVTLTFTEEVETGSCTGGQQINRDWTATDGCGNSTTITTSVILEGDDTPPVFVNVPSPVSFDCGETPIFEAPTATDDCSSTPVTITFVEVPQTGNCVDGRQIDRIWTATDACGNTSTVTTSVILEGDDTPPVFVNVPTPVSFSCGETPTFEAPIAEDNCSTPVTITFEEIPQTGDCVDGRQIDRIWTATDACGNTSAVTTSILLEKDDTPPVFTFVPETPDVGCDIPDFVEPVAEDDCGTVTLTFFEYQTPGTICDNGYSLKRDWTATDACGNTSVVTTAIWVNADVDAPVFTFVPETPDVDCDEVPDFITPIAEDDCGTVTLTFIEYQSPTDGVICEDGIALKRDWTATDGCGNSTTVTTVIWINAANPTTATVAGLITNEAAESIGQVSVTAEGSGGAGMMGNMMTEVEGVFNFDLPQGNNYAIEPQRNDEVRNGISTFDLILMGQHLLNVELLDSPYKLIAADVNNSGSITSLDLIALRRLILHLDDEFPSNTSWRFVEADYVFGQPTNPFASTFPEMISINGLNGNQQADFIGIKIGDLNGTAVPNELLSGDTRTGSVAQHLLTADARLEADDTKVIEIKAKDFTTMLGYQMTMNIDPAKAEVLEIIPGALRGLSTENFGYHGTNGTTITTSWSTTQALSLIDETVLFSLVIKAKTAVQLSEILTVNSDITAAEAYSELNGVMNMDLIFGEAKGFDKDHFTLYQNHPNPFEQETTIGFYLDNANEASLTIYTIDGKKLFEQSNTYDAGYHEVKLQADQLGEAGVMYYQLEIPNRRPQTRKMIWLKF